MIPFKWKRALKFFIQRRIRGFDDSETWSLDYSLAKHILPRLKLLKQFKTIHNEHDAEYEDSLDKMITAFDIIANDSDYWCLEVYPEKQKAVNDGLDMFRKHYRSMWW
jgi:hypothetical protein